MKARATLVLVLVLSLALVPVIASVPAHAQTQYSERLDVYAAGMNAQWSITLNKLATTLPAITSAESQTGLTGYRIVAMSTQDAISDYQIFGVNGYNLLKLPSDPSEGLFLTVNATSSATQSAVVSAFATQFGTDFTLVAYSGGSSTYFAPVDFLDYGLPILYSLVPTTEGGFVSFASESTLAALPMPYIELTATYNGTGFSHDISMGADATNMLIADVVNLSELIGSSNATLTSSSNSSSSLVVIHSLDGIVESTDVAATVSNHLGNFSGSYSLPISPGTLVDANVTLEAQPPTAEAYRVLDHGSLVANDTLGVTIEITNTGQSGSLDNVTVDDNWWQSYPTVFQLSTSIKDNYSVTIPSIAAGASVDEIYALKVLSACRCPGDHPGRNGELFVQALLPGPQRSRHSRAAGHPGEQRGTGHYGYGRAQHWLFLSPRHSRKLHGDHHQRR